MKAASDQGLSSAPYNMALVGYASKTNLIRRGWSHDRGQPPEPIPIQSLHCDKLAIGTWLLIPPRMAEPLISGLFNAKHGQGRRRGHKRVYRSQYWTAPPKSEGGIYTQIEVGDGDSSSKLRIEYNPAKMTTESWNHLHTTLKNLRITDPRAMWIDRYDAAFDYQVRRRQVILDDRKRKVDNLECGPWGPETERSGYRRGSLLKAQIYDKIAERRAANPDADPGAGHLSRFELQVIKPEPITSAPMYGRVPCPDRMQVGDLPYASYPGGDITVRCLYFHPLRVADPLHSSLTLAARGMGVRFALNYAKQSGISGEKRREFMDTMMPEVNPSPGQVWAKRWMSAAQKTISQLCGTD